MSKIQLAVILLAFAVYGQQPTISNAQLRTHAVTGDLAGAIAGIASKEASPLWVGYAVAAQPTSGEGGCCMMNGWRGCGLEGQRNIQGGNAGNGPVMLEGPGHYSVLFRITDGRVAKVQVFGVDCAIDAGGLPLVWLTGVDSTQSIRYLRTLQFESAIHAIAVHAGKQADDALSEIASTATGVKMRQSAIFWLAQSRGRAGYQTVARLLRTEPDERVRAHAVFALMNSNQPDAVTDVLRTAREDQSAHTRGQALFWLAQKAAKQASSAISHAIDNDPDAEVKKKAVFALTQMKDSEGVPMLIHVARNNANPAVRKQAMFWLGQSRDPRALKFFEEVLLKK